MARTLAGPAPPQFLGKAISGSALFFELSKSGSLKEHPARILPQY